MIQKKRLPLILGTDSVDLILLKQTVILRKRKPNKGRHQLHEIFKKKSSHSKTRNVNFRIGLNILLSIFCNR